MQARMKAKQHYDEKGLAALVLHIALIKAWNRISVATRQLPMEVHK